MSKKIITALAYSLLALVLALGFWQIAQAAGNINPINKWAWSTNSGWLNFNPTAAAVRVCRDHLEGFAWAENLGWIRLGTFNSVCTLHTYSNTTTADYGINRDSSGKLSGNAWSTNAGWIKFNPTHGGVTINPTTGLFTGYAWAENVGWIHFNNTNAPAYNVSQCVVKPNAPNLLKPKNNATITQTQVKFKWTASECAATYTLIVKDVQTGNVWVKKSVFNTHTKTNPLPHSTYRWFVKACNSAGCTKSPKFIFKN